MKKIEELEEEVKKHKLSQLDGTRDEPGATGPVQGSARGAGTSKGAGSKP